MRTANGIIAIGDSAIGVVAIGGVSIGIFSFGGLSVGLVSFGGMALGLLTAIGAMVFGSYTMGAAAFGVFFARGAMPQTLVTLPDEVSRAVMLLGWFIAMVGITVGLVAGGYAWAKAASAQSTHGR